MDRIFPLNQLDIIGCKEVPVLRPAMPRLLSPIFAVRDSVQVLFPPYTLDDDVVIRPEMSNRGEFDDLVASEKISAYGPVPAKPGHELWLDDDGNIRYDSGHVARKELMRIFDAHCRSAALALKSGSLVEARTHAMVAYSASSRNLEPLRYRAAAEHRMIGHAANSDVVRAELALTEMLAESHLSLADFRSLYLELARKTLVPIETAVAVPSARVPAISVSKFYNITTRKPARSKIAFPELCPA